VVTDSTAGLLARYSVPVSTICVGELIVRALLPKFRVSVPVDVTVFEDVVEDIVPVPVDVIVTFVPLTTPAKDIAELVPVLTKLMAPDEVSPLLPTVMPVPEEAVSIKLTDPGLFVVLLIVVLAVSVMYTAPCVLRERTGALVLMFVPEEPIVPVPPIKVRVPVVAIDSPAT
jgi:hypothetical protein